MGLMRTWPKACLLALLGIVFLVQGCKRGRRNPAPDPLNVLREPDDKDLMLTTSRVLPPPEGIQPAASREKLPPPAEESQEDALPALVVKIAERQDEIAHEHKQLRAELIKRLDEIEKQKAKAVQAPRKPKVLPSPAKAKPDKPDKSDKSKVAKAPSQPQQPKEAKPSKKPEKPETDVAATRAPAPEKKLQPVPEKTSKVAPAKKPSSALPKPTKKERPLPAASKPQADAPEQTAPVQEQPVTPVVPAKKKRPRFVPEQFEQPQPERVVKSFDTRARTLRKEARRAYSRIVKKHPDSEDLVEALMSLANMALEEGKVLEALKHYEKLIVEKGEDAKVAHVHLKAADLCMELKRFTAAREHFFAFADNFPRDGRTPDALKGAAIAYELDGESREALVGYRDILNRFPDSSAAKAARPRLAALYCSLEKFDEARKVYERMAAHRVPGEEGHIHGLRQLARIDIHERQFKDARMRLRKLLGTHPRESRAAEAMCLLAESYLADGRHLEAARTFEQAAERFPKEPGAMVARRRAGQEYATIGLHARAARQFYRLLNGASHLPRTSANEMIPATLLALATAHRRSGDLDRAEEALGRMNQNWRNHELMPAADLERAELLVARKQIKKARELLDLIAKVHKGKPQAVQALLRKAQLEEGARSDEELLATYTRLSQEGAAGAEMAASEYRRAVCLIGMHREAEAVDVLERLAESKATPPDMRRRAIYQMGIALERQGKLDEAIKAYVRLSEDKETVEDDLTRTARWKVEMLRRIKKYSALTKDPRVKR